MCSQLRTALYPRNTNVRRRCTKCGRTGTGIVGRATRCLCGIANPGDRQLGNAQVDRVAVRGARARRDYDAREVVRISRPRSRALGRHLNQDRSRPSRRSRHVWFSIPDDEARLAGLEIARKRESRLWIELCCHVTTPQRRKACSLCQSSQVREGGAVVCAVQSVARVDGDARTGADAVRLRPISQTAFPDPIARPKRYRQAAAQRHLAQGPGTSTLLRWRPHSDCHPRHCATYVSGERRAGTLGKRKCPGYHSGMVESG